MNEIIGRYELYLRAFLAQRIPKLVQSELPCLLLVDAYIAGYIDRLLKGEYNIIIEQCNLGDDLENAINKVLDTNDSSIDFLEFRIYYSSLKMAITIIDIYRLYGKEDN